MRIIRQGAQAVCRHRHSLGHRTALLARCLHRRRHLHGRQRSTAAATCSNRAAYRDDTRRDADQRQRARQPRRALSSCAAPRPVRQPDDVTEGRLCHLQTASLPHEPRSQVRTSLLLLPHSCPTPPVAVLLLIFLSHSCCTCADASAATTASSWTARRTSLGCQTLSGCSSATSPTCSGTTCAYLHCSASRPC